MKTKDKTKTYIERMEESLNIDERFSWATPEQRKHILVEIKFQISKVLDEVRLKDKTWGSHGANYEDQSVSDTLYYEQLKVLGYNQRNDELESKIVEIKKGLK